MTNTPTKTTATSMIGAQLKRFARWISRLVVTSERTAQPTMPRIWTTERR